MRAKSFAERALIGHLAVADPVAIDADDLRPHHPHYHELARADDRTADLKTLSAGRFWTTQALKLAAHNRLNTVWSTPLASLDAARWAAEHFKPLGYQIDVAAVAVDSAQSQLSILHRYQRGRDQAGAGRMVTQDYHDTAYRLLPTILHYLEETKTVDGIHTYNRDGQRVYHNTLITGRWASIPMSRQALDHERDAAWKTMQASAFRSIAGWLARDAATDPSNLPHLLAEHQCAPLADDLRPRLGAAVAAGAPRLRHLTTSAQAARAAFPRAVRRALDALTASAAAAGATQARQGDRRHSEVQR